MMVTEGLQLSLKQHVQKRRIQTMKKLSVFAAILCAIAIAAPMTCDAGFNIGNVIKQKVKVPVKTGPAVPGPSSTQGGHVTGLVLADGAPLGYANIYHGPGITFVVENKKVHIKGESHSAGMTDDKGKFDCAVTGQGDNYVIWKTGFYPILVKGVMLPSDMGTLTTHADPNAKSISFDK